AQTAPAAPPLRSTRADAQGVDRRLRESAAQTRPRRGFVTAGESTGMSSKTYSQSAASHRHKRGGFARELNAARAAALAAGEILERHYRERKFRIDQKGKDNPVTSADFEADRKIKDLLRGEFPDYGWLSEETADSAERLGRERVWIVDPLDGTKEFIQGVPEFVV